MSKKKKKTKQQPPNEIVKARYNFTQDEMAELGRRLAREGTAAAATEAEMKSVQGTYKARIAEHEARCNDLGNKITLGFEMRDAEASVSYDTKAGTKSYHRMDNGELIHTQPMERRDYELELALNDPKKDGKLIVLLGGATPEGEAKPADTEALPPVPAKPPKGPKHRKQTKKEVQDELAGRGEGDK